MLSARLRRVRGDAGITLAELIVTMTLLTILGTIAVTFFVQANAGGNKTMVTNQATADARVTLDSWTSLLRAAGWLDSSTKTDRFEEITPTKIVFYANLDNRPTSCPTDPGQCQSTGPVTKVALLLQPAGGAGDGQLVAITFGPDNTTPASVRRLAFNAGLTNDQAHAIFQPYNDFGGDVDVANTMGCLSGNAAVAGMCLQAPPQGAGMLDPSMPAGAQAPNAGPLRGNPDQDVDPTLADISGITIAFTVSDPANIASLDFTSSASVNSGLPS